jgi:hypothetical protein
LTNRIYRRVIVETPYKADTEEGIAENERFARACMRDCLQRGESPFASHLLYTQKGVLRDDVPEERALGIEAGLAWGCCAAATVVYTNRGISGGMQLGIDRAKEACRPVEYRTLMNWT